jgi:dihydrofolate reductase
LVRLDFGAHAAIIQFERRNRLSDQPRLAIAAVQLSLDGYMQGADEAIDWVDDWNDARELVPDTDSAVIGGGTYPGYEMLWGSIAADPQSGTAMLDREATAGELEYARWTQRMPHYVLSTTLEKPKWETAHLMRDISELRSVKEQPGGAIYVIGGPALVSSLVNEGLIDELRLIIHPIILGGGKAPFASVRDRQTLELVQSQAGPTGRVLLTYRI